MRLRQGVLAAKRRKRHKRNQTGQDDFALFVPFGGGLFGLKMACLNLIERERPGLWR